MIIFNGFDPPRDCIGASITGFVTLSSYFIQHLIDISSKHFSVALDIPLYNTSIYFSKLQSFRGLSTCLGAVFHYLMGFTLGVNTKTSSFISLVLMLFTRMVLIMTISDRYIVSVDVYKILTVDGFFLGLFQMAHFRIVSRYLFARSMFIDIGRLIVFVIQIFLDMSLKRKPLLMIRIQCWISFVIAFIAVCSWFFFLYHFKTLYPETKTQDSISSHNTKEEATLHLNKFKCDNFIKYEYRDPSPVRPRTGCRFREYSLGKISLFLMFLTSSLVRNFLFPGVLPYAVLDRDKCHSVNMASAVVSLVAASLVFGFYSNCSEICKRWNWINELCWIFTVPEFISLIYALNIIHRKVLFTSDFSGTYITVFLTTSLLNFSFGFIYSMARNHYQISTNHQSESLITYHFMVYTFYTFLFSKLSVGYNSARVEYEYCLTPFNPTYRKGIASTITFWVREVIRRSYNDVCGDFSLNIQDYL